MVFKNFLLRPANNEDVPAIKNVVFTILREYGLTPDTTGKDKNLDDVEKNFFSNNGYFGVAVDTTTNEITGTFGLANMGNGVCELRKMYLAKPVRGKGLGEFMLHTAIDICRQKGYKKIFLETISPLKEAISLYKKHGFKEITPHAINERVDKAFELGLDLRREI